VALTLASPKGGQPPIDPKSDLPEKHSQGQTRRHEVGRLHTFYVGGQGPMWDLVEKPRFHRFDRVLLQLRQAGCGGGHSPAVFHRAMYKGEPLVKGKRVTGVTNGKEEAVHLTKVVPFLVEEELKRMGGPYEKAADWESFAVVDGRLVTGQNRASSTAAARELVRVLAGSKAA